MYRAAYDHAERDPPRGRIVMITVNADTSVLAQISAYLEAQPGPKRADMKTLHGMILGQMPGCRLWFLDGTDETGRTVSNANIGYGLRTIVYADGRSRDFYQIGLSANATGISVYIMGLDDRTYLPETYGAEIGKASVTGYCIKFTRLDNINVSVLEAAIRDGIAAQ